MNGFVLWSVLFACGEKETEYEGDDPGECSDQADNDRDGAFDCDDEDCAGSPECEEDCGDDCGDTGEDTGSEDTGEEDTGNEESTCVPGSGSTENASNWNTSFIGSNDLSPPPTFDLLGWSVATCDFDGDGFDDVISTGPYANGYLGKVIVNYGPGDAWTSDTPTSESFSDAQIKGLAASEDTDITYDPTGLVGVRVRCGDIDGDGDDDLLIGRGEHTLSTDEVAILVFKNDGNRLNGFVDALEADITMTFDAGVAEYSYWPTFWVADIDPNPGEEILFFMNNNQNYATDFGNPNGVAPNADNKIWVLTTEGLTLGEQEMEDALLYKITPDGSDSVTSIRPINEFGPSDGEVDLFIGQGYLKSGSSIPGAASFLNTLPNEDFDVSGQENFRVEGSGNDWFGRDGIVGDFNGDGTIQMLVGAPGANNGSGALHYFEGDGQTEPTLVHSWDGSNGSGMYGLGWMFEDAGDFNGDGTTDIFVSAYENGKAYIMDGNCLGEPNITLEEASLLTITSESNALYFGRDISTGDIDGDGLIDLVIGAPGTFVSSPSAPEGEVFLRLSGRE